MLPVYLSESFHEHATACRGRREECFCRASEVYFLAVQLHESPQCVCPGLKPTRFNRVAGSPTLEESYFSKTQGRRPKNRPSEEGEDPDPGLASRRERDLTATQRGTLEPAWVLHKREEPQRPQCAKVRGPKDPGVAAPLAAAGCRGNCWCAGRVFSVASRWTTLSRLPSTSAYVLHGVWLQVHVWAVCTEGCESDVGVCWFLIHGVVNCLPSDFSR